jgi:hypothetical protein
MDLKTLTKKMDLENGASDDAISELHHFVQKRLPNTFIEWLRFSNGGSGEIGAQFVILYAADEIIENMAGYAIASALPGMLLFGSSGGGEAYLFDLRTEGAPVVQARFSGGLNFEDCQTLAPSFEVFLENLSSTKVKDWDDSGAEIE